MSRPRNPALIAALTRLTDAFTATHTPHEVTALALTPEIATVGSLDLSCLGRYIEYRQASVGKRAVDEPAVSVVAGVLVGIRPGEYSPNNMPQHSTRILVIAQGSAQTATPLPVSLPVRLLERTPR